MIGGRPSSEEKSVKTIDNKHSLGGNSEKGGVAPKGFSRQNSQTGGRGIQNQLASQTSKVSSS